MGARGGTAGASERPSESSGGPGRTAPAWGAVVWGANDDTRLLLRGLLRLERHPVVFEARTLDDLEQLPESPDARLLLVDAETSGDGPWDRALAEVLGRHPDLLAVVVLPRGASAGDEAKARAAGAKAVLRRPFAIHDLELAIGAATADAPPPSHRRGP